MEIKVKQDFLKQATLTLKSFEQKDTAINYCIKQLEKLEKEASFDDITSNPNYQNVVSILGPMAIYYKIDQVLKLLKELEHNSSMSSPFDVKIRI